MKSFWRSSFLTLIILLLDTTALALLWSLAYDLRAPMGGSTFLGETIKYLNPKASYSEALPFLLVAWAVILARFRFYAHHERIADLNNPLPILWAVVWILVVIAVYNVAQKSDFGRMVIIGFAASAALYLWGSRTLFRAAKRIAVERGHGRTRILVAGAGSLGREILARVHEHPDIGFRVVGFVAISPEEERAEEIEGYRVLGGLADLATIIQRHRIEEVFLAGEDMAKDEVFRLTHEAQRQAPATFKVAANLLYVIAARAKVDEVIGLPVIAFRGSELVPAEAFLKRLLDLTLATVGLVLAAPLAWLFALLIRLDSPGPAVFSHERVGLGGKRFRMLKFRTMLVDCPPSADAPVDENDPRVTRFGRFLRRTSLDEIPQLLNVLRGEMSLVGPRPEMPFIVEGYKPWQAARLEVKPGLSGLWQVAGRKNLPLHENLEYDFFYVRNRSLALDLEIILRTFPAVFFGRGAF